MESSSLVGTEAKVGTQNGGADVDSGIVGNEVTCRKSSMPGGTETVKDDLLYIKTLVNESVRQRETRCPNCGLPKTHKRTRLNYTRFACPCDVDVCVRGEEAREDYTRYGVDSTLNPSGDIACRGDCDQSMLINDPTPLVSLLKDGPMDDTPAIFQKESNQEVFENDVISTEAVDGALYPNTNNSAIGPERESLDNSFNETPMLTSAAPYGRTRNAHLSGFNGDTRRGQNTAPFLSGNSPMGSVGSQMCEIFYNPPKTQTMKSNFNLTTNKNNCYLDPSKQGMECLYVSRHSNKGFRLQSAIVKPVAPMPNNSFLCRPALGVHDIEIRFQNADKTCLPKEDTSSVNASATSTLSNNHQSVHEARGSPNPRNYGFADQQINKIFIGPCKPFNAIEVQSTEMVGSMRTYGNPRGTGRARHWRQTCQAVNTGKTFKVRQVRHAVTAKNNVKLKNVPLVQTSSTAVQVKHPYFSLTPPDVIATRGRVSYDKSQRFAEQRVEASSELTLSPKTKNNMMKKMLAQISCSSSNAIYGLGDSFSSERNNSNGVTSQRENSSFVSHQCVGRVVKVEGDGRCLFRSLVTAGCPKLQMSRRDEFGRPERLSDADEETVKADELRALVVRLMKDNLHFYSQLEKGVINADQPVSASYQLFCDRLEAMSNNHTMPGELELNAAAMVLERMIFVLNTDLVLITIFGQDRYPQSKPLAVRFTRLGPDVGHYDAVVLADDEPGDKSYMRAMGTCLKDNLLSARDQLSKLSLQEGQDSNKDGSTVCNTSSGHKQASYAPEMRDSSGHEQARNDSDMRNSSFHKETSNAPEIRDSSCHIPASNAPNIGYSSSSKQTSNAPDMRDSSCPKEASNAPDMRYFSCHKPTSHAHDVRYLPTNCSEISLTSRYQEGDCIEMDRDMDTPPRGVKCDTLLCKSNNNKGFIPVPKITRRKVADKGTQTSRIALRRNAINRKKSRIVHSCGFSSDIRSNHTTYAIVPQLRWVIKRGGQDKNHNSRSGVRKRRDRSWSDSESSPERKKKYHKFSPSPSGKKKTAGRKRGESRKENRYSRIDSTPGTSNDQRAMKMYKRKLVKRSKSVRSSNSSDTNVNPDVEIQPPKPPRLPEAFSLGQCQCLLCRKKVVMSSAGSSWLKCYICGRVAHRECVIKHSPAWGRVKEDDNYFLCNDCVPE